MSDASSYWSPLCTLVSQLRCWVRVASRGRDSTQERRWGQLLTMPTEGYLEGPGGPIALRDVEWVEVSTSRVKGGIAGRPRQMVDTKERSLRGSEERSSVGNSARARGRWKGFLRRNPCRWFVSSTPSGRRQQSRRDTLRRTAGPRPRRDGDRPIAAAGGGGNDPRAHRLRRSGSGYGDGPYRDCLRPRRLGPKPVRSERKPSGGLSWSCAARLAEGDARGGSSRSDEGTRSVPRNRHSGVVGRKPDEGRS